MATLIRQWWNLETALESETRNQDFELPGSFLLVQVREVLQHWLNKHSDISRMGTKNTTWRKNLQFKMAAFLNLQLTSMFASLMTWLGFYPTPCALARNRTQVSSFTLLRETLIQDALPTELSRPRHDG